MIGDNIIEIFNNLKKNDNNNNINNIDGNNMYKKNYPINFLNKEKKITIILSIKNGQEKFKEIPNNYFKNSNFLFFIYDISDEDSFNKIKTIIEKFNEKLYILIGCDLKKNTRKVSYETGKEIAYKNQNFFFEANELSPKSIDDICQTVIEEIFN